ncbi:OmpH family outer membrane protein [Mucilaginibacter psychrotolerans]|uniref:OmpH family outer membrane protein n=1 Tax=Mucilaginibacter psychrotolerans TaxID=1524096 RepID=A0A4Y8S4M7_9SPHI|nr:OmpH family outer membrane protein [Mucilaginibacter psychrotolerans]TFF33384.1 OmpH family outer membrane protein [Mucilaginibacter psychrotolerans]
MKKLFKVALVAAGMLFAGNFAQAQTKIAHINFEQLVGLMPETKTLSTQIDLYKKTFVDQLTAMNTELQTKLKDYQDKKATMSDAVRIQKETELQDLQKRFQDYQTTAQQQVEAKGNELTKPLVDKARAAIATVAKEKGYTYVLNSSQTDLIVAPDADDLMATVKLKLGLK